LSNNLAILRAMVEEKLYRVYEFSPWITKDEIIRKYLKKIKSKFKRRKDMLTKLVLLTDGEKSVLDISRELRSEGFRVSPEDIFGIYEQYRKKGIVRVKTVGRVVEEAPKEAFIQVAVAPAEEIIEKLEKAPEKVDTEVLKAELEDMLSKLEEMPLEVPEEEEVPVPKTVTARKVAEDIVKVKFSGIIENLFSIDQWIEALMMATREGDPVVFFSRIPNSTINQANLAAASAVIYAVGVNGSQSFEHGNVREILVLAQDGYIVIKPITKDYILISLISRSAKLGIALRDIKWVSNEMKKILQKEATEIIA